MTRDFKLLLAGSAALALASGQMTVGVLVFIAGDVLRNDDAAPVAGSVYLAVVAAVAMVLARAAGRQVARAADVRSVALRAETARVAACTLCLGVLILGDRASSFEQLVVVAATVVVLAGAGQFYQAARSSLARELLDDAQLDRGASAQQTANTVGQLVGAAVGPFVVTELGIWASVGISLAASLISWVVLSVMRVAFTLRSTVGATSSAGGLGGEGDDVRVRSVPAVRAVLTGAFMVTLGVGAASALDPYFLLNQLDVSLRWLSAIGVALSAGLIVGGLIFPLVSRRVGRDRALAGALFVAACFFLLYAAGQSIYWCLPMLFMYAVAGGITEAAVGPILMTAVPREKIPSVFAYLSPIVQIGSLGSLLFFGLAAGAIAQSWRVSFFGLAYGRESLLFCFSAFAMGAGALATARLLGVGRRGH